MPSRNKPSPLDDATWKQVFEIRCRSKRGEHIKPEELVLCKRALAADRERYASLDKPVFDATAPFGSRRED